ncbi:hypothetical protein AgCh_039030 [Apium graveolens]
MVMVMVIVSSSKIEQSTSKREAYVSRASMAVVKVICMEVLISAKEVPDVPLPPAVDALLKVHQLIIDVDADPAHTRPGAGGTVCARMLVAAGQGKLPILALAEDCVVEVQGKAAGVHKAI